MATITATGAPHLVPVTFALLDGDTVVTVVDHKPKRTTALQRLRNISEHPAVCLLADHYEDDWSRLWWVRADGLARVYESLAVTPIGDDAGRALADRYPAYRVTSPSGPAIVVAVRRWSGWSAWAGRADRTAT